MPRLITIIAFAGLLSAYGCGGAEPSEEEEGAGTAEVVAPGIRLSEAEQQAAGIATEAAALRDVAGGLEGSGWLSATPGREATVRATVSGFYLPSSESPVEVGAAVTEEQALGSLRVVVSAQERAQLVIAKEEADILMNQSMASLRLAEEQLAKLRGAERGAVSGARLAELQETIERSRVAYTEAKEQLPFLPTEPYKESLDIAPVAVTSPIAGRVTDRHVAPRQFVVQGDPLYTVGDWSSLWVRVPVFAGDLPRIDEAGAATVDVPSTQAPAQAKPVNAVRPAPEGSRTVDLFYELTNATSGLRPGQPVRVRLPLRGGSASKVVVPRSAILWDGFGAAWVYVRTGPEAFLRRRVELGTATGDSVAVERGLREGEQVVTVGAESLYGAEFEDQLQPEDDD